MSGPPIFVLNAVWQVALVWLAALVADLLLRRSAARRHVIWVTAVALSIGLPAGHGLAGGRAGGGAHRRSSLAEASAAGPSPAVTPSAALKQGLVSAARPLDRHLPENWGRWLLAMVVLFGVRRGTLMVRGLAAIRGTGADTRTQTCRCESSPPPGNARPSCEMPPIDIRFSVACLGPVPSESFQPVVVLPAGFGEQQSDDVVLSSSVTN